MQTVNPIYSYCYIIPKLISSPKMILSCTFISTDYIKLFKHNYWDSRALYKRKETLHRKHQEAVVQGLKEQIEEK